MMGKRACQLVTRSVLAGCHKGPLGAYLYESEAAMKIIHQTTSVNGCRMRREGPRLGFGVIKIVNRSREFSRSTLWVCWSILILS